MELRAIDLFCNESWGESSRGCIDPLDAPRCWREALSGSGRPSMSTEWTGSGDSRPSLRARIEDAGGVYFPTARSSLISSSPSLSSPDFASGSVSLALPAMSVVAAANSASTRLPMSLGNARATPSGSMGAA
jgi:hypothetical protein